MSGGTLLEKSVRTVNLMSMFAAVLFSARMGADSFAHHAGRMTAET